MSLQSDLYWCPSHCDSGWWRVRWEHLRFLQSSKTSLRKTFVLWKCLCNFIMIIQVNSNVTHDLGAQKLTQLLGCTEGFIISRITIRPDGIGGLQNSSLSRRFIILGFVVSKFTCNHDHNHYHDYYYHCHYKNSNKCWWVLIHTIQHRSCTLTCVVCSSYARVLSFRMYVYLSLYHRHVPEWCAFLIGSYRT